MKTFLFICLLFPAAAFSQHDTLTATLQLSADTPVVHTPVAIDTVNVTDSLKRKQGYWVYFGSDFPNSGVAASEVLEDGYFRDDQRTGLWYRYAAGGQIRAVMNYKTDSRTRTISRDQFYYYVYHPNGALKRKPVIGSCKTMSDYYHYDENGQLIEAELFDSLCNTSFKLQRIQKGEMDSISIFTLGPQFHEPAELMAETNETGIQFGQTGEYCADFNHRIFRIGTFQNGTFIEGKEFLVDEMMRPQSVKYYEGGKVVRVLVK